MDCPVCPRTELPDDVLACPGCGVDLTPARRIRELPDRLYNDVLALADKGENEQALERLMAAVATGGQTASLRILIGRILFRERRLMEAATQWRKALDIEPDNQEAARLACIADRALRRQRLRGSVGRLGAYSVAVVAVVMSLLYLSSRQPDARPMSAPAARAARNDTRSVPREDPVIGGSLQDLLRALRIIPGVTVLRSGDDVTVVFTHPVFESGSARLTMKGRKSLVATVQVMSEQTVPLRVTVQGFTNNLPHRSGSRWRDSWDLGFARACTAVSLMKQHVGSRATWLATSSGEANPPFLNDSLENRERNRTVVLHISYTGDAD